MRGADECPTCGSGRVATAEQAITPFYAATLAVCGECGTAWEPIDVNALTEPANGLSCFKKPCGNCAFIPGSEERKSGKLAETKAMLASNPYSGFYCHKGVPIDLRHTKGTTGFAYPTKTVALPELVGGGEATVPDPAKLRPCAGFIAWRLAQARRARRRMKELAKAFKPPASMSSAERPD